MIELSPREREFLCESNALDDIDDPAEVRAEAGHAGAYLDARARARQRLPLAVEDVCRWQRWICEEQGVLGHGLHDGADVARRLDDLIAELNERLAALGPMPDDVDIADALGVLVQRFAAIGPFVDGNGRTARVLASYVAIACGLPVVVFREAERAALERALGGEMAMRVFMADKIREAIAWPGRGVLERQSVGNSADLYDGLVVERHALIAKQAEWRGAAEGYLDGASK